MTALPDINAFATSNAVAAPTEVRSTHPRVADHYWGYVISPNEQVIDIAVLLRWFACLVSPASFVAAVGIWFVPASAFAGDAAVIKMMSSLFLIYSGILMLRFVTRGTLVRLHVDTSNGEIKQVVDGLFRSDVVLASHGMDAISGIDVYQSLTEPMFGQVHLTLKDGTVLPAGDGSCAELCLLRDRLARDLGVEPAARSRMMEWRGKITA